MSVLLSLPYDVCYMVFDEWVSIIELGQFDVALCCGKLRPHFHCVLPQIVIVIKCKEDGNVPSSLYRWAYNREMKFKTVYISDANYYRKSKELKCKFQYDGIANLVVNCYDDSLLAKMRNNIEKCSNLKSLYINSTTLLKDWFIVKNLTSLSIFEHFHCGNYKKVLDGIIDNCRSLQDLSLSFGDLTGFYEKCKDIVKLNSNLTKIRVSTDGSILDTLLDYCPNIEHIDLVAIECPADLILKLLIRKPNLKYFIARKFVYEATEYGNLLHAYFLNSPHLSVIVDNLKNLTKVTFNECRECNDMVLSLLIHSCHSLQQLSFSEGRGSTTITPNAVWQLVGECPKLWMLSFRYNLSDADLLPVDMYSFLTNLTLFDPDLPHLMGIMNNCPILHICILKDVLDNKGYIIAFKDFIYEYVKDKDEDFSLSMEIQNYYSTYEVNPMLEFREGRFWFFTAEQYATTKEELDNIEKANEERDSDVWEDCSDDVEN